MYVCMYIYIYIYTYALHMYVYVCMYVYIYIYMYCLQMLILFTTCVLKHSCAEQWIATKNIITSSMIRDYDYEYVYYG